MTTTTPVPTTGPGRFLGSGISLVVVALGLTGLLWYAVSTGLPAADALRAGAAVLATQVLPGAVCWRAVRPRAGWLLEDLVAGFAIGSTFAIASQVVAGLTGVGWLAAVLPFVPPVVLFALPRTRRTIVQSRTVPVPWWFGVVAVIAALGALPQLVGYFARNRLVYPEGAWIPHIDVYLHQALASQLKHRGPTSWPTVAGEDLGYHWFTHAWIAQTSAVSGLGLDEVLLRFMPALMPVLAVLAAAVVGLRLSGSPVLGAVSGLLTMAGGHLNVFGLQSPSLPIATDSPTLAMGVPVLMTIVLVLSLRWRGQLGRGGYLLLPWLAVAAAGTKGSTLPLVVAGLALAGAAMSVLDRSRLRQVLVDLAVVSLSLVFTLIVVFHGSSAGLTFGLPEAAAQTFLGRWLGEVPTARAQAFAIGVTALLLMSRGAAAFALPFSRAHRRDPMTWLLIGGILAGAGGVAVFSHPGVSQLYFAFTAIPLMAVGSALGLGVLARALRGRERWAAVFAALLGVLVVYLPTWVVGPFEPGNTRRAGVLVLVAAGVAILAAAVGAGLGHRGRRVAVAASCVAVLSIAGGMTTFTKGLFQPVKVAWEPFAMSATNATTQAQIDAARWIRDHSEVDDLVMTNRHCTRAVDPLTNRCDSRRWLVTAFSERQSLVEGWTATPRATRLAPRGRDSITVPYWKPDILRLNDGFIQAPTADAAAELWRLGVRWVYVDSLLPHAPTLAPYATLRYSNEDAAVWQLEPRVEPRSGIARIVSRTTGIRTAL